MRVYIAMECDVEGCGSIHVFANKAAAKRFIQKQEDEERKGWEEVLVDDKKKLDNWQEEWNKETESIKQIFENDIEKWKNHLRFEVEQDELRLKEGDYSDWIWREYEVFED